MQLKAKSKNHLVKLSILFTLFTGNSPGYFVKKGIPVIVIGGIIGTLGIIFHLQGQSLVGPESSFMYSNPDWITYGIQITLVGLIIVGIGTALAIMKKD